MTWAARLPARTIRPYNPADMNTGQNEVFSRVLIDKALEAGGWNLLDPHQVRFGRSALASSARLDAICQSMLRAFARES